MGEKGLKPKPNATPLILDKNYYLNNFNTKLDSKQEAKFQKWMEESSGILGRDISKDLTDYDLRGFWKGQNKVVKGQHGPDTYKKPSHPTFSDESIYHGKPNPLGGNFEGGRWIDLGGSANARPQGMGLHDKPQREGKSRKQWAYKPSEAMLKSTHNIKNMQKYFDKYEHDVMLIAPREKK